MHEFGQLAQVEGVRLIESAKRTWNRPVAGDDGEFPVTDLESRLGEDNASFTNIGAVMMNCDLVISCDSAIAHLAGALGVVVWVGLPFVPDWRWLLRREDTGWYPTMRLFRQSRPGDWHNVFERMADALRQYPLSRVAPEGRGRGRGRGRGQGEGEGRGEAAQ